MLIAAYARYLYQKLFERDELLEIEACGVTDMKDGEMREVKLEGNTKALLVKDEGQFHAVGSKCTHYGAPLVKGVYCRGVVRCPWHGACFNVSTGDLEDFPGLDALQKFEVKTDDNRVKIRARRSQLRNFRRVADMCEQQKSCLEAVLIIGGGPASVACAETLRQHGFTGRITLCSKEKHLPYDRPKLSKAMTASPDQISLRDDQFYRDHGIQLLLEKEAVSVDVSSRQVLFSDGSIEKYTKLLIATGATPEVPRNLHADHVLRLRDPDDAQTILREAADANVIVAGTSFVGMELASSLYTKAKSLTIVGRHDAPFHRFLGDSVGPIILRMFLRRGMQFCDNDEISEVRTNEENKVIGVRLKSGKELPADVIVAGVGVTPATRFLRDSGIKMNERGFITVDKQMRTSAEDVYAAGDAVEFPLFLEEDRLCNVQHWPIAHSHGRVAALSMLDKCQEINSVPYFWSVVLGKSIRYCGYGPTYDDVIVHEDAESDKFAAFYLKGDRVVSIASMGMDPIVSQVAEVFRSGQRITREDIQSDPHGFLYKLIGTA